MKRLPVGIQTFSEIIEKDYLYIDKTKEALQLIEGYKYAFLSRPRRFGKSLFLDTLHNIFEGRRELFEGLYIYDRYDFEAYPVIKIEWRRDMSSLEKLERVALDILQQNQERLGVSCKKTQSADGCFEELIQKSYEKYQKPVVILIDEYDKPILDNIEDIRRAHENRDFLRAIYSVLKANDRYIRFAFLTGISKFSKASIFSGLNNISDISLMSRYATICGYTQKDIDSTFAPYLEGVDREKIRLWYNGYNFLGESVYNPFDILLFIDNDFRFKSYWWESGNAFALVKLLKKGNYYLPSLQNLKTDETLLNSFDIENLKIESLLFQAGYLTIDSVEELPFGGYSYRLRVPNMEVQISLNNLMIDYLSGEVNSDVKMGIYLSLSNGDMDAFKKSLEALFSSIAHDNYRRNDIAHYEGYYASIVYAYLAGSALKIRAEDVSNRGRIDLSIEVGERIYILEFKVGKGNALEQIRQKRYYEKYMDRGKEIYLVGINFDEEERNIAHFEWDVL